ncbi:MAG: oxidoreductase [Leptospira sp.]|nr:MAG: oxidoreductase [Leptospira sp.]
MKKVKVLLIGLGRIASLLENDPLRRKPCTHAGTLLNSKISSKFDLKYIWDENPDRISAFQKQWKTKAKAKILPPNFWKTEEIDLAIIATSTDSHWKNLKNAIESNIPNLLVEKPLVREMKEARRLLELQRNFHFRLWVNHERRFHPVYAWAKTLLESGELGKIKTIYASVLTSAQDPGIAFSGKGGGPLLHDGTHAIDLIHWFLGMPNSIQAKFHKSNPKYKIEEQAYVWMQYENEANVFLEVGGYRKYFQFEIDIQTTQARFLLGNHGFQFFQTKKSKLYKGFRSLEKTAIPKKILQDSNPFPRIYKEIAKCIIHDLEPTTGSLNDNLEIMKILTDIKKQGKYF